jgi:cyanate permease
MLMMVGGILGLLFSIPAAIFCGKMYQGFGGGLTFVDDLIFASPKNV